MAVLKDTIFCRIAGWVGGLSAATGYVCDWSVISFSKLQINIKSVQAYSCDYLFSNLTGLQPVTIYLYIYNNL